MSTTPTACSQAAAVLTLARHGQASNLHYAAGVVANAALEFHVRQLCHMHGLEVPQKRRCVHELAARIRNLQGMDKPTYKRLKRLATIGRRCANNLPVDWAVLDELVDGVAWFVNSHPADDAALDRLDDNADGDAY